MTAVQTLSKARPGSAIQSAWMPFACLAAGLAAFLLLFHQEAAAAVTVWIGSTAYNHCFLVLPIVAYLIWDRRDDLAGFMPRPTPAFALLALPVAAGWFVAERIGYMEGRQLVALTGLEVLLLAMLGQREYRRLLGPLLYLYFLVPFGDFLTPRLQQFTADFAMHGLDLLGIPNFTDGLTIQIPEGTFVIAEACAGLRFLIAAIAFGCLYALLIYRSPLRRILFIAASLVVPVIANGFRALGIVVLGHVLGSAQAAETDHILYGWIFFSIVLLILIALGLPFREDQRRPAARANPPPASAPLPLAGAGVLAALLVLVLLCVGPALAVAADWTLSPAETAFSVAARSPCNLLPGQAPASPAPDSARLSVAEYSCNGVSLVMQAEVFAPRTPPGPILKEREIRAGFGAPDAEQGRATGNGIRWTSLSDTQPRLLTASVLWSDGHVIDPGLVFRLHRAWQSMVGGGGPVVLLVLKPAKLAAANDFAGQRQEQAAIGAFLQTQTGVPAALAAASPAAR